MPYRAASAEICNQIRRGGIIWGSKRSGGEAGEKTRETEAPLWDRRRAGSGGVFRGGDVHIVLFAQGAAVRGRVPADSHRHFPAEMLTLERSTYEDSSAEKPEAVCRAAPRDVRH